MIRLVLALAALALAGCATFHSSAGDLCGGATAEYRKLHPRMIAALIAMPADDARKGAIKGPDRLATAAIEDCANAAEIGDVEAQNAQVAIIKAQIAVLKPLIPRE